MVAPEPSVLLQAWRRTYVRHGTVLYLTALITLLGPAQQVSGMARITYPERVITSEPLRGQRIQVEVPTLVIGLIAFAEGALAHITTTFDTSEKYAAAHDLRHGRRTAMPRPQHLWRSCAPQAQG